MKIDWESLVTCNQTRYNEEKRGAPENAAGQAETECELRRKS